MWWGSTDGRSRNGARSRRKSEREKGKVVGRECGARERERAVGVWGYVKEGDEETVG
jgi:hypothetical protein